MVHFFLFLSVPLHFPPAHSFFNVRLYITNLQTGGHRPTARLGQRRRADPHAQVHGDDCADTGSWIQASADPSP